MQEALQAEKSRLQLVLAEEEQAVSAAEAHTSGHPQPQPGPSKADEKEEDELDAFMGQVAVQLEQDKVGLRNTLDTHAVDAVECMSNFHAWLLLACCACCCDTDAVDSATDALRGSDLADAVLLCLCVKPLTPSILLTMLHRSSGLAIAAMLCELSGQYCF